MAKLSKAYIQAHRNAIHSYSSLGETLFKLALDKAEEIIGDGEEDSVTFDIQVELSPFMPTDCIRICISTSAGEKWCMNQQDDKMYKVQ